MTAVAQNPATRSKNRKSIANSNMHGIVAYAPNRDVDVLCKKMKRIAIIAIVSVLAGCSGNTGPDTVVARYYSSSAAGDFDAFLSCLSADFKQECMAEVADEAEARDLFSKLPAESRKLAQNASVTKVETHGTSAMVWVVEGKDMPEDGQVFSLSRLNGQWSITDIQMLVTFYKNGSRRDWEKTQNKRMDDTAE
jgi:hypothetical protein